MGGRSELQSGAVLLTGSAVGLVLLRVWDADSAPVAAGTAYTGQGFVSAVIAIMLVGVLAIGACLLVLGAILWLVQRRRDQRLRATAGK